RRARKVLSDLEAGRHLMPGGFSDDQMELQLNEPEVEDPLIEELKKIDPDSLTPLKALEILYELRDRLN
ncbi:MAG: hypothetical protein KAW14_12980, partial [Candidatus Aegiribacteria sp.]|nr:hypothetical protein [Candidatus Aegiribacteria sp.]